MVKSGGGDGSRNGVPSGEDEVAVKPRIYTPVFPVYFGEDTEKLHPGPGGRRRKRHTSITIHFPLADQPPPAQNPVASVFWRIHSR